MNETRKGSLEGTVKELEINIDLTSTNKEQLGRNILKTEDKT